MNVANYLLTPGPAEGPGIGATPAAAPDMLIALNGPVTAGGGFGAVLKTDLSDVTATVGAGAIVQYGNSGWRQIYQARRVNERVDLGGATAYWDGSQWQTVPAGANSSPNDLGTVTTGGTIDTSTGVVFEMTPSGGPQAVTITGGEERIWLRNSSVDQNVTGNNFEVPPEMAVMLVKNAGGVWSIWN